MPGLPAGGIVVHKPSRALSYCRLRSVSLTLSRGLAPFKAEAKVRCWLKRPRIREHPPMQTLFRGSFTALITPFRAGALDEEAFKRLVE